MGPLSLCMAAKNVALGRSSLGTAVTLCYATSLPRSEFLTRLPSLNSLFSPLAHHFSLRRCSVGCIHADAGTHFQLGTALCSQRTTLAPSEAAMEKPVVFIPLGKEKVGWSTRDGIARGARAPIALPWVIKNVFTGNHAGFPVMQRDSAACSVPRALDIHGRAKTGSLCH